MRICHSQLFLSCRCSGLAGADTNGLLQIANHDSSVANPARTRDIGNRLEHRFDDDVVHGYLDFGPRAVLGFIHLGDGHALHAQLSYGVSEFVQLEGPNDSRDHLHDVHFAKNWP